MTWADPVITWADPFVDWTGAGAGYSGNPILDENGNPILDENGQPIEDEYPRVTPAPPVEAQPRGTTWTIYVRDDTGRRRAELTDYSDVVIVPRFNRVGSWSLRAKNSPSARLLATPKWGVEFVRNGVVVLSGPVTTRTRVFDAAVDGFMFDGADDTVWLARRLASPQPNVGGPPYSTQAYDVRTGLASTVLRSYVDVNAGPAAVPQRQVRGLLMASDPNVGSTVTGRARWQPLLELLQGLAASSGLGFRIRGLAFEVYSPADRSAAVKFSTALGNLAAFQYSESVPEVNWNVAAGGGEGTARVIREGGNTPSVERWGRIEAFQDRRDTTDPFELDQANQATLAENATKVGFSLTPIETESVRFLDTYQLGDRVTVIVDGVSIVDVVREVVITLNDDGETVVPTIGDPTADPSRPRVFEKVRQLEARMNTQERR